MSRETMDTRSTATTADSDNVANLEQLQVLLEEGVPKITSAAEKDLVMVIGNTGSGKSTAIKYLTGSKMCRVKRGGKWVIEPIDGASADICHRTTSGTLYPEAQAGQGDLVFGDFPGFLDNRSKEARICASICTELAVKKANSVKSIIVAVDYKEIDTLRGQGFKRLSLTLANLFKNTEEVASSILFLITKTDGSADQITVGDINAQISQLIADLVEENEKIKQRSSSGLVGTFMSRTISDSDHTQIWENEHKLRILSMLQQDTNNIMILDSLDHGQCRQQVIQHLSELKEVDRDRAFDFRDYDSDRKIFDRLIFRIAREASSLMLSYQLLPEQIENCQQEITEYDGRVNAYAAAIARLEAGDHTINDEQREAQKASLRARVTENNAKIADKNQKIRDARQRIATLRTERAGLNTNEKVLFWDSSIKEKRSALGLLGYTSKRFQYNGGVAYNPADVVKTASSANRFSDEKTSEAAQGKYSVLYESGFYEDGDAKVEIKLPKRSHPDNIARTGLIDREINQLTARITHLEGRIRQFRDENTQTQAMLANFDQADLDDRALIALQIENTQTSLRLAQQELDVLRSYVNDSQEELEKVTQSLRDDLKLYELVMFITETINYDSSLINNFQSEFIKYLQEIATENAVRRAAYFGTSTPREFECPISLDLMRDPTQANCGHSFDRLGIMGLFEAANSHEVNCPCCRKPINDRDLTPNISLKAAIEAWARRNSTSVALACATSITQHSSIYHTPNRRSSREKSSADLRREQQELEMKLATLLSSVEVVRTDLETVIEKLRLKALQEERIDALTARATDLESRLEQELNPDLARQLHAVQQELERLTGSDSEQSEDSESEAAMTSDGYRL